MAIHIQECEIRGFRGIRDVAVTGLNHINLITGDNNSGKTSVLEALYLLCNFTSVSDVYRLARMRDLANFYNKASLYESFINLFPKNIGRLELSIEAVYQGATLDCFLSGEKVSVMTQQKNRWPQLGDDMHGEIEVEGFLGQVRFGGRGVTHKEDVVIDETTTAGQVVIREKSINAVYLSQIDHLSGNVMNRILRNDGYKEVCIKILQMLDPGIVDLLLLKNGTSRYATEYLRHETLGVMPLSTYGDGVKKLLLLANGIARAVDGVLFIDEIETAIHAKYHERVFRFLEEATKQFNVQVFLTTHSSDAIDGLFASQDYGHQGGKDSVSVMTLKREKASSKTYSRVLSGRHAYENREAFGFEVRL